MIKGRNSIELLCLLRSDANGPIEHIAHDHHVALRRVVMDASTEGLHLVVGRDDIKHIVLIGHQTTQAAGTEFGHEDELWYNCLVRKVNLLDKRLSCRHLHLVHLAIVVDEQIPFIIFLAGIRIAIKFVNRECETLLDERIGKELAFLGFHLAGIHVDKLDAIFRETESIVGVFQIHTLG